MTPRAGISGWCVRHPIATALLTLASLLLGLLAFLRLGVAPLPEADFPTIQINALLPGGSPKPWPRRWPPLGSAVQRDSRDHRDDFQQRPGHHHPDPAVQPRQEHRRRRPGGPGGDQRRGGAAAGGHAEPADLAQGQPGGQPDHDPAGQLGDDAADRTQRLRRDHPRPPAQPGERRGADLRGRPAAPGDPHPGPAGKARRLPADPGRPAPVVAVGQRQPGQGRALRRGAGVDPRGQRPVVQRQRL